MCAMNGSEQKEGRLDALVDHPLIKALSELSHELLSVRFMILIPDEKGWREIFPDGGKILSDYCRLVQSTADGAKHCRMCHVLMSAGKRSENRGEQQCHGGARVLVATSQAKDGGGLAVLSACTYHGPGAFATVRSRARKLGIDVHQMEKAFRALPRLTPKSRAIAQAFLKVVAEAVAELQRAGRQPARSRHTHGVPVPSTKVGAEIEARLSNVALISPDDKEKVAEGATQVPMLVRILLRLVDERPELPFIEKDIALAARTTPNYLSALFRQHVGMCFTDYVSEKRLALAKNLLRDMTLGISDVSRQVGYDDPGYFARVFRQATGLSPRDWRQRHLTPGHSRQRLG